MPQKTSTSRIPGFLKSKWVLGILALVVIGGGYYLISKRSAPEYQFVSVTKGSVAETVSVTGNTIPVSSVSLGFGNGAIIARVYSAVGKKVGKGELLAELNTSDLNAQIRQAEATLQTQQAKLEGLRAGAQPEDVAAAQASLDKTKQDLANLYASVKDVSEDSYAKAQDAVRTQLDDLFSNDDGSSPKLTFLTSGAQTSVDAESERLIVGGTLNTWQGELAATGQSDAALEALIQKEISYLSRVRQLLNSVAKSLDSAVGLSATTLGTYKAAVSAALTAVNTASKNLNTVSQNIATQKLTISQAQAQLDLKKAGTTPQDVAAQEAQVANSQASLESAQSKLQNSRIVAPISGVITQFDAKVGQFASPGAELISIISDGSFEIEAQVAETDVGKIAVNNTVTMSIDAFPGETFTGTVFYIDPAQTTTEGVVGYKIKASFDKADMRFKSGLTVNMEVETRKKDDILVLPQYAILQNDEGTFVQVVENGTSKNIPVILGIQDKSGNVEVVSGVSEGQQVLNIGLKPK